jgi:NADPH-dependent ferric siderophore reductase
MASAPVKDARPAYRPYRATVSGLVRLSAHFIRVTFTGPDLEVFGTDGFDQRLKIVLPIAGLGLSDIGADDERALAEGNWYARWRALPDERRNPFRTYTIRAARPAEREIDVDMVCHGDGGPASRWLGNVTIGEEVYLVGPDSRSNQSHTGIDWHPGDATEFLLAGDETAAPAICSIIESLPSGCTAHAFIEIPAVSDRVPVTVPVGCTVTWLSRGQSPVGDALDPAVRDWIAQNPNAIRSSLVSSAQQLDDIDIDRELLWHSPEATAGGLFYAWLAGEAAAIKRLRRFLVSETGIDRKRIAFMGYWRAGKAEAQ